MRRFVEISLAIIAAIVLFSLLGYLYRPALSSVNVFSLVVVYFSITEGAVVGAITGTACGLIQDSFSAGIFGLAGLTKTLLGFLTGSISRHIDVVPFFRRALFILVMASLELGGWVFLKALAFRERVNFGNGGLLLQPLMTAILAALIFHLARKFRGRAS